MAALINYFMLTMDKRPMRNVKGDTVMNHLPTLHFPSALCFGFMAQNFTVWLQIHWR